MSFFQNVMGDTFIGNLVLGDRQYVIEFRCPPNKNNSDYNLAWINGPYDLSVNNTLTINYAFDVDFKNYSALAINIAGAAPATTTAAEIVAILNANATFADMWVARVTSTTINTTSVIIIAKPDRIKPMVRTYISNSSAEIELRFNLKAGVAELPTYFTRHTIANRFAFTDSAAMLIALDESVAADQVIIENAGFDPAAMLADWELFAGRSGIFNFYKYTIDGSNRITQIIEYPAGAKVGDFAKKTTMTYTGANTNPDQKTEIPYVLGILDLIQP